MLTYQSRTARADPIRQLETSRAAINRSVRTRPANSALEREADESAERFASDVAPHVPVSGGGRHLPDPLRNFYESRFGHDFSQVRLHNDRDAATAADAIGARAFTIGHHVFFGRGEYAPQSRQGRTLLAHELTHVTQGQAGIHCDRKRRSPGAAGPRTGWNSLPPAAQKVLRDSYEKYKSQPDKWLWRYYKSAAECFDKNLKPERQRAFRNVYHALQKAGLWGFVERVTETWPHAVQAIKFEAKKGLRAQIESNRQYCRDPFGKDPKKPKWRQVVPTGTAGLHLIIPATGLAEAHIDRIAPVAGREADGACKINYFPYGIHHLARESWGLTRSQLMLGGSAGLAASAGRTYGFGGLDIDLAYRFASALGRKLQLQGKLRGEVNNLFSSASVGVNLQAEYRKFGAYVFGGGIGGRFARGRLGAGGRQLGGLTTSVGAYYRLDAIALRLGVEYNYIKNLVQKDSELHRLMLSAKIIVW